MIIRTTYLLRVMKVFGVIELPINRYNTVSERIPAEQGSSLTFIYS
jgi:hypothetical protein